MIRPLRKKKKCFEIDSVVHYQRENNNEIVILEDSAKSTVFIPPVFNLSKDCKTITVETPNIYYSRLFDSVVFGSNNSILVSNYCLNDKIFLPTNRFHSFVNGSCISFDLDNMKCCFVLNKHSKVIEEGINMFGEASLNYYHWMMDILGRIFYINKYPELKNVPLLVDQEAVSHQTYAEALNFLDDFGHPIVILKPNESYVVKKLHYFSPITFSGVYPLPYNERVNTGNLLKYAKDKNVISFLRHRGLKYAENTSSPVGGKLFIRRNGVQNRLINEDNISSIAKKYGFELFNPGNYSLKQQIAAFRDADIIIGDEGAAFTNSVFASPNAIIAIIIPSKWNNYVFSTIASDAGVRCIYLDASLINENESREHLLDEKYFESFLKSMI